MSSNKSIHRVYSILFILVFMLALTFSALDVTPAHAAGILYATPGGTGDCSSWANACTLQTALTGATSGDEIWVAAGTYTPGTLRTDTFQLKNGVALYGGFAGTETARSQRNPSANVTTLSGDIGTPGDNSDNSYHVVTGATGVTLDGFTIKAGNANSAYPNDSGGGMYNRDSSPTLTNVTFSGNSAAWKGGGMFNYSSSPTLTNVTFNGNSAIDWGGGMYNYWNSSPTLTNVTFSGNSANLVGGGMGNYYSNPTLTNVTFSGNTATNSGGGMYNHKSWPTLTNVTFSGNSATCCGGGLGNYSSSPTIYNTIFWGNTGAQIYNYDFDSTPVVSDSVVQGGCPFGSKCTIIITTDPMLGALGNYGGFTQTIPLLANSSAINTGNDATCAATDQRGIARPQGAHCDIGSYEYEPDTIPPTVVSVTRADANHTNAASVNFTVTFSVYVTGVGVSDFSLTTTGVSGASVTGVSGSGSVYTVTAITGNGNGTIRLDVPTSATITDLAGNPLASLPYTGGETYTITKVFTIFLPLILR